MDREWIYLPAEPSDSLAWPPFDPASWRGEKILWQLQLGLERGSTPFEEEAHFEALGLGLRQFSDQIWPRFQEFTEGVVLYRGLADRGTRDQLAHYCQMLCYRLPDEVPVFLFFDLSPFSRPSEALQFLSKDHFAPFRIGFRGLNLPLDGYGWDGSWKGIEATRGVVFPERGNQEELRQLDQWIREEKNLKVIFESFLSEDWEGLEELWLVAEPSPVAKRKIEGFCAAGGIVRGRGI